MKYKFICIFLLVLMLIRPVGTIYQYKDKFFSRDYQKNYQKLYDLYYSSQYVKKINPGVMPDEYFEAFAGGAFLKGLNPILIVHDHPPLGRYIVSLSIILFDNASTIIILFMMLSSLAVFLISRLVLKNTLLSLIPLGIFLNEPLALNKLVYTPLPEPIQLPFIYFAIYFFIKGVMEKKYKKWFLLTVLMLGGVISTRFFVLGGVLVLSMLLSLFIYRRKNKKIIAFLCMLPISLVILMLSYTRTIQDSHSLLKVFSVQKYILVYHKSAFVHVFSFWDLILFNRWHTWWGSNAITSDVHWIILWPIGVVGSFLTGALFVLRRITINPPSQFLLIWIFAYSGLLSTGYTSTRYFLPIIPFLYIITLKLIIELRRIYIKK